MNHGHIKLHLSRIWRAAKNILHQVQNAYKTIRLIKIFFLETVIQHSKEAKLDSIKISYDMFSVILKTIIIERCSVPQC